MCATVRPWGCHALWVVSEAFLTHGCLAVRFVAVGFSGQALLDTAAWASILWEGVVLATCFLSLAHRVAVVCFCPSDRCHLLGGWLLALALEHLASGGGFTADLCF